MWTVPIICSVPILIALFGAAVETLVKNRAGRKQVTTAEPDPLVELQEVHRLELQDWDFAFQCATGKEAFPSKPTIVQGCYDPMVDALQGLRTQHSINEQQIRNKNYIERQRRQVQQAQGMMNMLDGLGNPFR